MALGESSTSSPGSFLQETESMASAFFCSAQHYPGQNPPPSSSSLRCVSLGRTSNEPPLLQDEKGLETERGSQHLGDSPLSLSSPPPQSQASWGRLACLAHLQWLLSVFDSQPVDAARLFETKQFLRLVHLF